MVCAPGGVPGVVWWLGDEELHPESETRALTTVNSNKEWVRSLFIRRIRFGENARKMAPAQAMADRPLSRVRCSATPGAVVETVRLTVAVAPFAGVSEAGANVQATPVGSVPQEKCRVPLYPPMGVTVSVVDADWPAAIVAEEGDAEIVKSGANTTTETGVDALARFAESPA
jgi:hypothetical protein